MDIYLENVNNKKISDDAVDGIGSLAWNDPAN